MTYYRVKPEKDQTRVCVDDGKAGYTLIGYELWTHREVERVLKITDNDRVARLFDAVEVSKKRTHWFFGCRYADDGPGPNEMREWEERKKATK